MDTCLGQEVNEQGALAVRQVDQSFDAGSAETGPRHEVRPRDQSTRVQCGGDRQPVELPLERGLDGSGMLVASLPSSLVESAGSVRLRVTAPLLGSLELDPATGTSARPVAVPVRTPASQPAPAQPAPAQVPTRSGLGLRVLPRAA